MFDTIPIMNKNRKYTETILRIEQSTGDGLSKRYSSSNFDLFIFLKSS